MSSFIAEFGAWNWLILAAILLVLEMLAPGVFMLWFGVSAVITGLVSFATGIGWQWQLGLFAVLSLISVVGYIILGKRRSEESDRPLLNERAGQQIGRSFTLVDPIANGRGRIKIGDSLWRVEGPDMPGGARVRVTGAEGTILRVEAAENDA